MLQHKLYFRCLPVAFLPCPCITKSCTAQSLFDVPNCIYDSTQHCCSQGAVITEQTCSMVENALVYLLKIARPNVLTSAGNKKNWQVRGPRLYIRSPGSSLHSSIKAADCFSNNKLSMYDGQQGSGTSAMQPSSTTN